jgi:hypothetical protein
MLADPIVRQRLNNADCDPALQLPADRIAGGPHAVEPLALLRYVREHVPRATSASLVRIEIPALPRDGHVDLRTEKYDGKIDFQFATDAKGLNVGAVVVDFQGLHDWSSAYRTPGPPLPDPQCKLDQIWQAAVDAGVHTGEPVHVTYQTFFVVTDTNHESASPTLVPGWDFNVGGRHLKINDRSCAVDARLRG